MRGYTAHFSGYEDETTEASAVGVTDPIALKGKAMENIIFAVDQLTEAEKWAISYKKSELITKCSFNGEECKVDE
uniref:SCP domain-containing protein n=1 Tax=Angiostrongylus cantonensis TaxID=6313 RepID=A0A0K0CZ72_ANGCA